MQGASKLVGNAGVGLQVKVLTTMSVKNAKLQVLYGIYCHVCVWGGEGGGDGYVFFKRISILRDDFVLNVCIVIYFSRVSKIDG